MDRDPQAQGDESTAENRRHVENAAENRDALAAQAQRTQSSAPDAADAPVGHADGSGPARDPDNAAAMRAAQENRDALEEQNRRVEATVPSDVDTTGPSDSTDR